MAVNRRGEGWGEGGVGPTTSRRGGLALLLLAALAVPLGAQEGTPAPPAPAGPAAGAAAIAPVDSARPVADPTRPDPRLAAALRQVQPAPPPPPLPALRLLAVVRGEGRDGVALLAVEGRGNLLVRPGEPFALPVAGGQVVAILRELTPAGARLEVPERGEILLVP